MLVQHSDHDTNVRITYHHFCNIVTQKDLEPVQILRLILSYKARPGSSNGPSILPGDIIRALSRAVVAALNKQPLPNQDLPILLAVSIVLAEERKARRTK
jgi:hypothetical protein